MLTRKHFRAFAEAIADIGDVEQRIAYCRFCSRVLSQFNGRFDYGRFERACGISWASCPLCGSRLIVGADCRCMGGSK